MCREALIRPHSSKRLVSCLVEVESLDLDLLRKRARELKKELEMIAMKYEQRGEKIIEREERRESFDIENEIDKVDKSYEELWEKLKRIEEDERKRRQELLAILILLALAFFAKKRQAA